jgi:hypothetical protein
MQKQRFFRFVDTVSIYLIFLAGLYAVSQAASFALARRGDDLSRLIEVSRLQSHLIFALGLSQVALFGLLSRRFLLGSSTTGTKSEADGPSRVAGGQVG